MLDDEMKWKVLPPMPKPDSHIEFAWVVVNNTIVIVGGTTDKHPVTKKMTLVGEVMQFDLDTMVLFLYGYAFYALVHDALTDNYSSFMFLHNILWLLPVALAVFANLYKSLMLNC